MNFSLLSPSEVEEWWMLSLLHEAVEHRNWGSPWTAGPLNRARGHASLLSRMRARS